MLSARKVASNITLASRSFMRSAYAAQMGNRDPINQKMPSDRIIPDIRPEQDASPIDDPASTKWSNRNSESENISVDAMSRPNLKEPNPNPLLHRESKVRASEDMVDASNRFPESSSDANEISSGEKLRGAQSQVGQVPNQEEWDASSDLKSTAKEYMSDIKHKAHDIKDKVKENVKEKTNDYVEDLSEKASAAKAKQDEWLRKSSESYEDMKHEAKEKTSDTMEKIKEMPHRIKEKVKDITGIGKD